MIRLLFIYNKQNNYFINFGGEKKNEKELH